MNSGELSIPLAGNNAIWGRLVSSLDRMDLAVSAGVSAESDCRGGNALLGPTTPPAHCGPRSSIA